MLDNSWTRYPQGGGNESMRINSQDQTIKKNYIQKYRFLIKEYEDVKKGVHPRYGYVQEFYKAHDLDRRTFRKYYNGTCRAEKKRICCRGREVHVEDAG
jgi:hypothetical protein